MTIVGVLAIQGDVRENIQAARRAMEEMGTTGKVIPVKTPSTISDIDSVIIPGGESTTIGQLSLTGDTLTILSERIRAGMPTLGICAGLVLLARTVHDRNIGKTEQPLLGVLDIRLERNSFGRQRYSCEMDLSMPALNIDKFRGIFIRAPSVSAVSPDVEPICVTDNRIVAVRHKNIIGTSFHPELSGDTALHKHMIKIARR